MKHVFLAGGGSAEQSYMLDKRFFGAVDGTILYVPYAMRSSRWDACEQWFSSVAGKFGASFVTARDQDIDFSSFAAVYIGGGNTFRLASVLRERGLWPALRQYVAAGGLVYGGSAGAIILGDSLLSAREYDEEAVEMSSYDGLGVIEYVVWPHYTANQDLRIRQFCKEHGCEVLALSEDSGAVVRDGILGVGDVFVLSESGRSLLEEQA